jgi:hypothetical protein
MAAAAEPDFNQDNIFSQTEMGRIHQYAQDSRPQIIVISHGVSLVIRERGSYIV